MNKLDDKCMALQARVAANKKAREEKIPDSCLSKIRLMIDNKYKKLN